MLEKLFDFFIPKGKTPVNEEPDRERFKSFASGDEFLRGIKFVPLSDLPEEFLFMGERFFLAGRSNDDLTQRIYMDENRNTLIISRDYGTMKQEIEFYDRNGKDLPTRAA